MPDPARIEHMEEPIVKAEIILPKDYIGTIMELCQQRRGVYESMEYLDDTRAMLIYHIPLNEIIYDFFDVLKSRSRGYASFDYSLEGYQQSELVKLDILVNRDLVDALSFTEAEARITNEMMPYTSGAFSVSAVKRSNISEIFWDENGDHFYKAKINLITLDENTGAERKKAIYILVQASDLNQAAKNLAEGMRGTVSDYEVASIVKTPIVDAYKIAEK